MCFRKKYQEISHTDIVVNKYTGHHAISYCWVVNDYFLVLKEYGELSVSKEDYQNTRIGKEYTWTTKERIK